MNNKGAISASPVLPVSTLVATSSTEVTIPEVIGLQLNTTTGVISGTPLDAVNTSFQVEVVDESGSAVTTVNVVIVQALKMVGSIPQEGVGNPFSFTPTVTGGNPSLYQFSYTCNGGLPKGLTFNTKTGGISGTCTSPVDALPIIITCTDGTQSTTLTVTLNVLGGVSILPNQTAIFSVGVTGSYTIQGTNLGTNPVFTVLEGVLPPGLTLDQNKGIIIGEPTTVGSFPLSLKVTGPINTAQGKIIINVVDDITITTPLPTGTVGVPYSFVPAVSGGNSSDYVFTLQVLNNQVLIPGLSFNSKTGAITGTPTQTGYIHVTITVTDGQTSASMVNAPLLIQTVAQSSTPQASDLFINQLLQKYVNLLTMIPVTDEDRQEAIQTMSKATNVLISQPTESSCETFFAYHTKYKDSLFQQKNFFVGEGILPNDDSSRLGGVYMAFRMLVTNPTLNVSMDYLGAQPINCVELANWILKKRNAILQALKDTKSNG